MNLLDTDVLIDIQRGHPPAVAWFQSLPTMPGVPGFVVMELIQSARNQQQVKNALNLIAPLKIHWPTEVDCMRAISQFSVYHLSHGLGLIDCLNAATAVGFSVMLYTFNGKHYRAVPGLSFAEPYIR